MNIFLLLLLIITVMLFLVRSGWGVFDSPLVGSGILNTVPGRGRGTRRDFAAQNYFGISSTGWQSREQPRRAEFPLQEGRTRKTVVSQVPSLCTPGEGRSW